MARYRHPRTVGLALEHWPEADRASWQAAFRDDDPLLGRGPASRWTAKSRLTACKAYGNWLRFLSERGPFAEVTSAGERLSRVDLRAYIDCLRTRVAPTTVVTQLRSLSVAIAAMDPSADRELLKLAISRLGHSARSVRDKSRRLVTPRVLLDLGLGLMARWQQRAGHDPRLNAMDYRDGLMIAFLALCPLRVENLAAIIIGQNLTFEAGVPRVAFSAHETKSKRPLDIEWPALLRAPLEHYLSHIHPMLYGGQQLGAPLWPSLAKSKPRLTAHGIYTRLTQVTRQHLGEPINPHMFRDAAATHIAELVPEHAMMAAAILQHQTLDVTMRHYIHGQQHRACHAYHEAVADLIAKATKAASNA